MNLSTQCQEGHYDSKREVDKDIILEVKEITRPFAVVIFAMS